MKLDRLFLPIVLGAVTLAPPAARAGDDPSTVLEAYTQLRDAGCDVSQLGSPIAVRALRNVPYAQQGKIFKSAELTYLYEHDGVPHMRLDLSRHQVARDDAARDALHEDQVEHLAARVHLHATLRDLLFERLVGA